MNFSQKTNLFRSQRVISRMSGNLSVAPALVFALAVLCPALPGRGELPLPPASEGKPSIGKPGALPHSVATWNLQWFPGNRPKPTEEARQKHEKSVAEILPRLGVDLLVLEEIVDRKACERATSGYSWKVISDFQRAADEDPEPHPGIVGNGFSFPAGDLRSSGERIPWREAGDKKERLDGLCGSSEE
ncbi:MAG: hypothetical protein EBT68_03265 [Verrucomicrobia bacterium]|nr:hypothetical protein [Verrucomicrobiota bacterium]